MVSEPPGIQGLLHAGVLPLICPWPWGSFQLWELYVYQNYSILLSQHKSIRRLYERTNQSSPVQFYSVVQIWPVGYCLSSLDVGYRQIFHSQASAWKIPLPKALLESWADSFFFIAYIVISALFYNSFIKCTRNQNKGQCMGMGRHLHVAQT